MKTDQDIDESLVKAYLAGDKKALAVLVKRWHKQFCDKAYWMVKDKDVAKDIAQDSWTIIIKNIASLKHPKQFKFWAYRIVINKSTDWLRIQSKNRQNKIDYGTDDSGQEITDTDYSQLKTNLFKAIQELPEGQKAVIKLFYIESYSIKQISEMLDISAGTTKSRLFHAREKLKQTLKQKK
ncbi:RNA polymerase sigma factor [Algibacter luteus]|uniref:RNA polymerase sigma-70 factor, ECF subfamily n=1 Tax=Algibacter luteus TaxID=1178825 RepID=A0A1M6C428_9FLAO|nr:sigma-70 family RNA polymerase sigma factor [Algibacter luteus]SHI55551.1 RNA polymerase sigma-70 factor, ECF subfamily [Algibacter luteus]